MNSDSDDFEYEDTYTKKKAKAAKKPSKPKAVSFQMINLHAVSFFKLNVS